MKKQIIAVSLSLILSSSVALAMDHSKMDHGDMNHGTSHTEMGNDHNMSGKMADDSHAGMHKATEGTATGVVHSVSKLNRSVNLTHAPIAALNWPEMTMDLAVVDDVDLNSFKPGDKVEVHIVLDQDKVYRIHRIVVL